MRNFILALSAAVLMLIVSVTAKAQDIKAASAALTVVSAATSTAATAPEVLLLRTQLEDNRRFQEQLLSTVLWSLGTLASLAVLMIGFGWFANFRMYERDKQAMLGELRTGLFDETRKVTEENIKNANTHYASQQKLMQENLSASTKNLTLLFEEKSSAVEKRANAKIQDVSATLSKIKDDVLTLEFNAKLMQRQSWIDQNVPRNALQASVDCLKIAIAINYDGKIGDALDLVATDMKRIHDSNKKPIDNFLIAQLIAAFDTVVGSHAHAAAGLKGKASELTGV